MKGQITIVNLLMLFIVLVIYIVGLMPVLNTIIDEAVADMTADPFENSDLIITIMRLIPLLLIVMIIMTGFIYAIPRREGEGSYGV